MAWVDGSSGTLKVEGAANLRKTLRQAGDDLADMKDAHKRAAEIAARASADLAPRRSGKLVATVRSAGTKTAGIIRAGMAKVPYAGPIHWGWGRRHITANPFMSRGAQDSEGRWVPVYEDYVQHAIDQVKGA